MLLTAHFTSAGIPATGLSATIDIYLSAGTQVVTAASMTEVAGGFYQYDFTAYDETVDYFIRADGSATLSGADRYVTTTNEIGQVAAQLTSQDTVLAAHTNALTEILGLSQANFVITGQTYNGDGCLTAAAVTTYPTAADAASGTNKLYEYSVAASYDGSGNLINYSSTRL
jgi:hypothetical protein